MEVEISVDELRKKKIFVATPMYGGQCAGVYTKSCTELATLAAKYGIDVRFFYLFNESLITRARNYLVDEFIRSDCTHLMFIDSDIGFDPNYILTMAAMMDDEDENNEYDVLCGPYPKKTIAWEKVAKAVDKGYADDNPSALDAFVGDYVFNPVPGTTEIKLNEPVEVLEGGTGFMMIKKKVFDRFAEKWPDYSYRPDHVRTKNFDGSREIMMYFQALIDDKTKRYLSEDYMFCQYARESDSKVWYLPWMELKHVGMYIFGGTLQALAAVGASPTADQNMIEKMKK